ncbi:MAG: hypothetical protein JW982_12245 [Spirochaetes bacterium]|nr:hypothetical protein [Spirochaetota bacterium]
MKFHKLLLALLLLISFFSCSQQNDKKDSEIKRLTFNENKDLLNGELDLTDLNIKIAVPAGSVKLSAEEIKQIEVQVAGQKLDNYSSEIIDIYVIKEKKIIFSISRITQNSYKSYAEFIAFLNSDYLPDFKNRRTIEFFKDEFYMAQFMCFDENNTILKSFVKNNSGPDLEINFLMPSSEYNNFSRTIESVIASIKKIK